MVFLQRFKEGLPSFEVIEGGINTFNKPFFQSCPGFPLPGDSLESITKDEFDPVKTYAASNFSDDPGGGCRECQRIAKVS